MSHKISGKLWLDGSSRVSVTIVLEPECTVKLLLYPEDKAEDVLGKLQHAAPSHVDSNKLVLTILSTAEKARQDPQQLRELEAAVKRIQSGAEKSRSALLRRVRTKKEEAFKKAAADLMDRGLTKNQLFQLIRESIVEGVHEK
jgi:hypothetical protein